MEQMAQNLYNSQYEVVVSEVAITQALTIWYASFGKYTIYARCICISGYICICGKTSYSCMVLVWVYKFTTRVICR